jgi:hypothetical protein
MALFATPNDPAGALLHRAAHVLRWPARVAGGGALRLRGLRTTGAAIHATVAAGTMLVGAQLLPLALLRHRPVPTWAVMATGTLLGLLVIDYYPVVTTAPAIAVSATDTA